MPLTTINRLTSGAMLVLETKGQYTEKDQVKCGYLDEWTKALNSDGSFCQWRWAASHQLEEVLEIPAGAVTETIGG